MDRPVTPLAVRMLQRLSLPLFARELLEQAARPRTYVIRVVYATLLFALFGVISWTLARNNPGPFGGLGQGGMILRGLVVTQFFGVYLFMPALTCGVITLEKEQGSFALLLLTRLGPTTILVEKLLSRLVPMATFFFLTLPLLAFAFTLGGVEVDHIWLALWLLSITALQVGCLSLMCSAWCQYTVSALIVTYLVELVVFGLPAAAWNSGPGISTGNFPFFAPGIFAANMAGLGGNLFRESLPILGSCVVLFGLSRLFVVRRAFPGSHTLVQRLRQLNAWGRLNLRGRHSVLEIIDLPEEQPIVWQESRRSPIGVGGRMAMLGIVLLLVFLCYAIGHPRSPRMDPGFATLMFGVWIVAALLVTVKGASLVAKERSHQTLDVLLSTPLSARELISQKFSGIWRLIQLLWLPFLTVILLSAYFRSGSTSRGHDFPAFAYICCSISMVAIYLPMCAWLSCWIGLRSKNQMRAIITSLAVLVTWCVLTLVLIAVPLGLALDWNRNAVYRFLVLLSPMATLVLNESSSLHELGDLGRDSELLPALINAVVYFGCWRLIRRCCLRDADRCLGRMNEREQPEPVATLID